MRNIILLFARRIAPIFVTFGWVIPQFKIGIQDTLRPEKKATPQKPCPKKITLGKNEKKIYSRRLTRTMENYAKD